MAEGNIVAGRLRATLSNSLSATKTLAFVIEKYGVPDDFDGIAQTIMQSNPFVDAVELTRKGIITHVYPLKGNEPAIGYDVLSDPRTRSEAIKALEENRLFFAGPFTLKQGGVAVVGRLPIYRNSEFWGFSVVIIKLSTLLDAIGIKDSDNENFSFQLSKTNPLTGKEEFFLDTGVPTGRNYVTVQVSDGEWKLYVVAKHSVNNASALRPIALLGLVLAAVAGVFVTNLTRQPELLKRRVKEATHAMERVNRLYQFTSQINRMAVKVVNETQLYNEACRIAIDTGTYKMAWIGLINEVEERIDCVSRAGEGTEYVDEIMPFSIKAEENQGPVVSMIQANDFVYCNDISTSPLMVRYRDRALKYGFQAVTLLPIRRSGKIIGSLNLYSSERDPFDEQEIRLLRETSETMGFVMDNLEVERLRTLAENLSQTEKILSDSVINSMPGVFYFYDRQGKFLRWNKNFEIVSGYSGKEIEKMHPLDFFRGVNRELLKYKIENVFTSGADEVIANFLTKDSREVPYYFNGKRVTFGSEDFLIGMGLDITDRLKAEHALRERNEEIEKLSLHLQDVREEERSRIALEIHDVLGQQLTAIKMDATWVKRKSSHDTAVLERITTMIALVDDTIRTVRRISSELRPGILDDLGLVAALEWQGAEFERNAGIKVSFQSNVTELDLPRDLATNVFRIYQEALTNVARHAHATHVTTRFTQSNDQILLVVSDDGIGIDVNEIKTRKSIGLISMKERARNFNGEVVIGNKEPNGTVVTVTVQYVKNTVAL